MKEDDGGYTVTVDAPEKGVLSLGQRDESHDHHTEKGQDDYGTDEAELLANGAEDEVGVLLGHVFELRLCAVKEAFAQQAAGADGDLGLVDVVARSAGVVLQAEGDADALLLVGLEHVVEDVVDRQHEGYGREGKEGHKGVTPTELDDGLDNEHEAGGEDDTNKHPNEVDGYVERGDDGREEGGHEAVEDDAEREAVVPKAGDEEHLNDEGEGGDDECAGWGGSEEGVVELHHGNEEGDGADGGQQQIAGHAFAIEHQGEGEEDEGRAGLFLHQHKAHGQQDDEQHEAEVAQGKEVEVVAIHQARQGQGGGELGELGGLQADGAEDEPGARPLDVGRQKDGGNE